MKTEIELLMKEGSDAQRAAAEPLAHTDDDAMDAYSRAVITAGRRSVTRPEAPLSFSRPCRE